MKRGTLVLTVFPFTNLLSSKRRPSLVVSAQESPLGDVIVAFASSVVTNPLASADYLLDASHADFVLSGLVKDSVVKADKLATLNKSIFTGILGELSDATMQAIDSRLKWALALT